MVRYTVVFSRRTKKSCDQTMCRTSSRSIRIKGQRRGDLVSSWLRAHAAARYSRGNSRSGRERPTEKVWCLSGSRPGTWFLNQTTPVVSKPLRTAASLRLVPMLCRQPFQQPPIEFLTLPPDYAFHLRAALRSGQTGVRIVEESADRENPLPRVAIDAGISQVLG